VKDGLDQDLRTFFMVLSRNALPLEVRQHCTPVRKIALGQCGRVGEW
jgi:hypothetical protein